MNRAHINFLVLLFWVLVSSFIGSCRVEQSNEEDRNKADNFSYTVEPAPLWTELFNRDSGWFGGDGIFAIPLTGSDQDSSKGIVFLFSDTMYGQIIDGDLQEGYDIINNSVMILDDPQPNENKASFNVRLDKDGKARALFIPQTDNAEEGDYYWLGDGFVNAATDTTMYVFAHRIRHVDNGGPFPFQEMGTDIIAIPSGEQYPYENQRQFVLPFSEDTGSGSISYGVGIFENTEAAQVKQPDGYLYVYGLKGMDKQLLVSRVKAETFELPETWEFFTGDVWSSDPADAQAIADSVSNEISISEIGEGKYALIYQYAGILPNIYMQIGESPVGPFGPRIEIWNTRKDITEENLFTYNAKAHPSISKPGELLVSYNVNSFDFLKQIEEIPNLYRPRFIKIKFNQQENE